MCWLQLPGCTLVSTTGDHVIPVDEAPHLALVRANVRGACSHCNYARGKRALEALSSPAAAPALAWFQV